MATKMERLHKRDCEISDLTNVLEVLDVLKERHGVAFARILDRMDLSDSGFTESFNAVSDLRDKYVSLRQGLSLQ